MVRRWMLAAAWLASAGTALAAPDPKDRQDFAFADRGFVAQRKDPLIRAADGRTVWDLGAYRFVAGPPPESVDASLWRNAQLLAKSGLYKVADGVWQVRGFDIANVTFVAGRSGWIVIDPLGSTETAAAALALANETLGARPVTALVYTHSHADHFGGAKGVLDEADAAARRVPVVAPAGFLDHAISENVIAGAAMGRRATYQFGVYLPKGPQGQVTTGLGLALSRGTLSLIAPTVSVEATGQTIDLDGVTFEFQLTPDTEAPAEMNFYLPGKRILDLAENANATMHNVLTPRGALVRDAKGWADGLGEAIDRYGERTDMLMTSHGWPRFGRAAIADYLGKHRDVYKYLHDQSVRMMNAGATGDEIAARLRLPPALADEWYNRGYYGSLSFNARAVYQRYMGWYDANPVHLAPLPRVDEARRTVDAMGGRAAVMAKARAALAAGDDAWGTRLLDRLVFADPADREAREALAAAYDRMAGAQENAVWRNAYLTGALELRRGVQSGSAAPSAAIDLLRATPTAMLLDLFAVRLDPAKAGEASVVLAFPERREVARLTVRNGVLTHRVTAGNATAGAIAMPRAAFLATMAGLQPPPAGSRDFARMVGWFDKAQPPFAIVEPVSPPPAAPDTP